MEGICKLCQNKRELRQSHILPEFMYQNIYDEDPKRFYYLNVDLEDETKSQSKIHQKGIREYLLCDECEGKFSKYEDYAAETIYGKRKQNKAYITHQSKTLDGLFSMYDYKGFSYKDFKIFLMSILWRLIISDTYTTPNIDPAITEKLRVALYDENPLDFDDFGCLIQVIQDTSGKTVGKLILQPYMTGGLKSDILNILVDGFVYSFYLNAKAISESQKSVFVKPDGTMQIIGRQIYTDQGLMNRLKAAYEFFAKRINK